jgi:hypothetical protein
MAEAVIPPEITMVSPHVQTYDEAMQDQFHVMMLTTSMNEDGKQLSKMHGTIRCSDAITSSLCIVGTSRWMI